MASVFLAFVTQPDVIAKMFGLGLGLAILIDVLVVRLRDRPGRRDPARRPGLVAAGLARQDPARTSRSRVTSSRASTSRSPSAKRSRSPFSAVTVGARPFLAGRLTVSLRVLCLRLPSGSRTSVRMTSLSLPRLVSSRRAARLRRSLTVLDLPTAILKLTRPSRAADGGDPRAASRALAAARRAGFERSAAGPRGPRRAAVAAHRERQLTAAAGPARGAAAARAAAVILEPHPPELDDRRWGRPRPDDDRDRRDVRADAGSGVARHEAHDLGAVALAGLERHAARVAIPRCECPVERALDDLELAAVALQRHADAAARLDVHPPVGARRT